MIIPITTPGGPPGGSLSRNTNITSPIPATAPSAIPPRRTPIRMQPSRINSSIQSIVSLPYRWRRRSVVVKELLDLLRWPLFQKGERQQDPCFLRVQFVRRDEAQLVVVHLDVSPDRARRYAGASNDDDAFLR